MTAGNESDRILTQIKTFLDQQTESVQVTVRDKSILIECLSLSCSGQTFWVPPASRHRSSFAMSNSSGIEGGSPKRPRIDEHSIEVIDISNDDEYTQAELPIEVPEEEEEEEEKGKMEEHPSEKDVVVPSSEPVLGEDRMDMAQEMVGIIDLQVSNQPVNNYNSGTSDSVKRA